ncbi:MAG: hypothetical protein WC271_09640 [Bacteroidales bacterium]|jgi:hypothetical protein|nr:hypothetical protein [Bacteroidales bacterium]MDD2631754.1 hypothetical protein [Bacteroidales bacterium]MDD3131625.1 hypothetical protein [Bacteroidales bacterium]MDD4176970.1 hypothetical protein [Bacteroidales bacterium]NCU36950.1 hypothetical protein [Candidatus Falkowbacteria bacterium]
MFKRRIFYALALLIAGSAFLVSCNDDDDPVVHLEPTITITPVQDTAYLYAGDTVNYQINISADDDLISVKFTGDIGGMQQILLDSTLAAGNRTFSYQFGIVVPSVLPVGTTGKFTVFAATNFLSTIEDRYFKIIPPPTSMSTHQGVTLQAQADGATSANTNLSFYSASANERFTLNQAAEDDNAAKIDLVFTHHSVFKGTLTNAEMSFQSPNESNLVQMWNEMPGFNYAYNKDNKNQTYFKKLTTVDWDNLNYEAIQETVGDIGMITRLRGLNDGDYIGFMTEGGKYGIIKVTATNVVHNPYNASTITFDVKIQD